MKCERCGEEIEDGLVYCTKCGQAVQMVPDYNILEDDILPGILDEEKQEKARRIEEQNKKRQRRKAVFVFLLVLVAGGLSAQILYFNSYAYLQKYARETEAKGQLAEAQSAYERLLQRNPEDGELLLALGRVLLLEGKELEAKGWLQKGAEAGSLEAEQLLLDTFIDKPGFSKEEGQYSVDIELAITSPQGYEIFYTMDGSDPSEAGAMKYTAPLEITEGETLVRAVCRNGNGKWGEEASGLFFVYYTLPEYPEVSPGSGSFSVPTRVTITTEVPQARIYYTWNGSRPNEHSSCYTGPIWIPEGSHILSILVVDGHGQKSEVLRCSYAYRPGGSEGGQRSMEAEDEKEKEDEDAAGEEEADSKGKKDKNKKNGKTPGKKEPDDRKADRQKESGFSRQQDGRDETAPSDPEPKKGKQDEELDSDVGESGSTAVTEDQDTPAEQSGEPAETHEERPEESEADEDSEESEDD